jgi:hypothetical protein
MTKFHLDSGKDVDSFECLRLNEYYADDNTRLSSYSSLYNDGSVKETDFYSPNYFDSGDCSGSLANKSNREVFLQEFGHLDGVIECHGAYGHQGILIRLDVLNSNSELQECVFGLENYPVLDEEHWSELEEEAKQESWDYTQKDFLRALNKKFNYDFSHLTNDFIYSLFSNLEQVTNTYWYFEHCDAYFPIDDMMFKLDREDVLSAFEEVFNDSFDGDVEKIRENNEKAA